MTATETPTIAFPSTQWFERLGELMVENRERHVKVGTIDCVAQFTVLDPDGEGRDRHFQVAFEEYEVTGVREVAADETDEADFVIETDAEVWQEMIETIVDGEGDPGLEHSLNRLSLPGVPMRVWSVDPLRRDMFFRFNTSLQEYFNACYRMRTEFVPLDG